MSHKHNLRKNCTNVIQLQSVIYRYIQYSRKKKFSLTFLQCPNHLHLTVSPLELIKEGTHFELVDGSSLQLTDHHPVLPRGVYLQDTPLPLRLAVLSGNSVKHLVALDVRGLLLDLTMMQR